MKPGHIANVLHPAPRPAWTSLPAIGLFVLGSLINVLPWCETQAQTGTPRINEFMALNQTTLADKDGEYEDWIEIYNPSSSAVDLQGWSLTDDSEEPRKWLFSQVTVQAQGYLVVFASGKNLHVPGGELHTNFKLAGEGEYLALVDAAGTIITKFAPAFPRQLPDVSYGYYDGDYVFSNDPTPGAENRFSSNELLPPPAISPNHGFFDDPISVAITTELQNTQLYYTTDGSEPDQTHGTLYTAPFQVNTTTVLRVSAFKAGGLKSRPATRTYLFLDDVINQPNNPPGYPSEWGPYTAITGTAPADYEMDPEITRNPQYSGLIKDALLSLPAVSIVTARDNLFSASQDPAKGGIYVYTGPPLSNETNGLGFGWERPASFEFFNNTGSEDLQVDCGLQLHGGHSRRPEKSPKHSFRLVFKADFGPTRLEYPLFENDAVASFDALVLRAGFGNVWHHHSAVERQRSLYVSDSWAKYTQLAMGHPAAHGRYVHLYLNGLYWGVYNLAERIDSDFAASYMGGDELDYDVIKDYAEPADGNLDAWNEMTALVNGGLASNAAYQRIQGNNPDGTPNLAYKNLVDVVSLIDYMLLNFYAGNTDWDHHNWIAARSRTFPGKGFKFFSWDTEHILEATNHNMLDENNSNAPSALFQALRQNAEFRRLFADRVQLHCFDGGALTPEATRARWQKWAGEVDLALIAESARWGDYRRDVHPYQPQGPFALYSRNEHWNAEQNFLVNQYFPNRTNIFLSQLRQAGLFPGIAAPVFEINDAPVTSNVISPGDVLSMTATRGTIYYTDDGNDPLLTESSAQTQPSVLIPADADKWVLVPGFNIGATWRSDANFNDSGWQLCSGAPGGIGYERDSGYQNWITLDLAAMYNSNTSCYIRIPFTLASQDLDRYQSLFLAIRYDDGFIAYLNGNKVAEANAPASSAWNSAASAGNEAGEYQSFDLSAYVNRLVAGKNLLAIHGLNASSTSSDFIIMTSLLASEESGGSGEVSPSAMIYSNPIPLNETTPIKARVLDGQEWSALQEMVFVVPGSLDSLKVTEIHYHPLAATDINDNVFEFIEIKNTGMVRVDLSEAYFAQGITFRFPLGTVVNPGGFIVLVSHRDYFYSRYGIAPLAEFIGSLDNTGERIALLSSAEDTVFSIRYNDKTPWPVTPDGQGYSLVPKDANPVGDQNDPSQWRQSYSIHGSPGQDDNFTSAVDEQNDGIPEAFRLDQNFPNPFNHETVIVYHLPLTSDVELMIYDVLGRKVKRIEFMQQSPRSYRFFWNGMDDADNQVESGVYFYRIRIGSAQQTFVKTQKMVLLK